MDFNWHLTDILHISDNYVFCIIEESVIYISNNAILQIASRKKLLNKFPIDNLNYEGKIEYCQKHFLMEDIFHQKDGIALFGEKNDLQY